MRFPAGREQSCSGRSRNGCRLQAHWTGWCRFRRRVTERSTAGGSRFSDRNEITGWQGTVVQWSQPEWMQAASALDGLVQIQTAGDGEEHGGGEQFFASADCSVSRAWLLTE